MSEPISFKPAVRTSTVPLIVFYAESGCGKTLSALFLARGIAGDGAIAVIDTENGRASMYSDIVPNGYSVAQLTEPYTPKRYVEYVDAALASGAKAIVIDSGSHEWEGAGGVLNMAGDNEDKSGRPGLHNWKKPKLEHALFVAKLLRCPVPIIVCLRAKHKSRQVKGTNEMAEAGIIQRSQIGKTAIIKDEVASPIQSEDFIFEATVHGEINQDHTVRITKGGHPELRKCFPADNTTPIKVEHGQAIAAWMASGGPTITGSQAKPSNLKADIWNYAKSHFKDDAKALQQFLWDEGIMTDKETLKTCDDDRLAVVFAQIKSRI